MAGPRTRRNAGGVSTNNSGTSVFTHAVSCASTPAPAQTFVLTEVSVPTQALALIPTPTSTLGPPGRYIDKDLQRTTKLTLELFVKSQEHGQLQTNSP